MFSTKSTVIHDCTLGACDFAQQLAYFGEVHIFSVTACEPRFIAEYGLVLDVGEALGVEAAGPLIIEVEVRMSWRGSFSSTTSVLAGKAKRLRSEAGTERSIVAKRKMPWCWGSVVVNPMVAIRW